MPVSVIDNLAATFSPALSDLTFYVIDVAAGEKIPRKGGPGHHALGPAGDQQDRSGPMVGASLDVMATGRAAIDQAVAKRPRRYSMILADSYSHWLFPA